MNRILLLLFLAVCSMIGFLVKLPKPFRHVGFEMHAAFYFCASIVLLLLFPKRHFWVGLGLATFGVMIEFMQEFSNLLLNKKIHGNFDPKDVAYNLTGIFLVFVPFYGFKILKSLFK